MNAIVTSLSENQSQMKDSHTHTHPGTTTTNPLVVAPSLRLLYPSTRRINNTTFRAQHLDAQSEFNADIDVTS